METFTCRFAAGKFRLFCKAERGKSWKIKDQAGLYFGQPCPGGDSVRREGAVAALSGAARQFSQRESQGGRLAGRFLFIRLRARQLAAVQHYARHRRQIYAQSDDERQLWEDIIGKARDQRAERQPEGVDRIVKAHHQIAV